MAEIDLRPEIVNVLVTRGDAWSVQVTYPGDISGAEITAQLRDEPDSATAVDFDIAITDAVGGIFTYGQTTAADSGVYDVEITLVGGLPRTYIRGLLSVDKDVTHA